MNKKSFVFRLAIVVFFIALATPLSIFALNYTISFTGSGASNSVDSVIVQNLTKGTTVTVPAGNVLNLTDVATSFVNVNTSTENISIYPNPMQEISTVSFFAKSAGLAQVYVFSIDGKKIIGVSKNLSQGNNSFELSMPKGAYTIQIQGNDYSHKIKVISQLNTSNIAQIHFSDNIQIPTKVQMSKNTVTTMLYTLGDQLLYKGKSGNYTTIVTDKPNSDRTSNFEFVECTDADGNNYSVVKIGNQTWMAENLRTQKYTFTSSVIPIVNDNTTWIILSVGACCDYNNDPILGQQYGKLYNWFAVKDSRHIAPMGWHVPILSEWDTLSNYLDLYTEGGKLKDSRVSVYGGPNVGATNESGFTAFPSGWRSYNDGTFSGYDWESVWWCALDPKNYGEYAASMYVSKGNNSFNLRDGSYDFTKVAGCSIRCIKD